MKKQFTANIIFLIGINLLIKPFYSLAIDTSIQNIVGEKEYGLFMVLFNFVYIQQIFSDLGLQNYNNRAVSRDPEKLKDHLSKTLGAKLLFISFFFLVVLISAYSFGYLQYLSDVLIYIMASQACLSLLLFVRTNISGSGHYMPDSIISVLDKLLLIIWLGYIIWFSGEQELITIGYFVRVQLITIFIALIAALCYLHFRITHIGVSFNWKFTRSLLKEILPYATVILLMAGYSRIDSIMLDKLLSDGMIEAGKYAASFRLYDTFNNFLFLFAVLLLPMFSKMIKQKDRIDEMVHWSFRAIILGCIFIAWWVYFDAVAILELFYNRAIDGSYIWSFRLLMLAAIPLGLNYIFGTLLTASGDVRVLNYIALSGFLLNIVLNLWSIPNYGASGAAFTTMITQFIVFIIQYAVCHRNFTLGIHRDVLLRLFILILVTGAIFYVLQKWTVVPFFLKTGFILLLYVIMAFLLKLIRREDFQIGSFTTFVEE